jgi:Protein of unknown function (DUF1822)
MVNRSKCFMPTDFSEFQPFSDRPASPLPQAGEIWQLCRTLRSPRRITHATAMAGYSLPAQRFLQGDFPDHYVMIVKALEPEVDLEEAWQAFSVMVLCAEMAYLSDVDLLIPTTLSGWSKDLLAQTWHILPMLGCNLQRLIANRLSRDLYDRLITVGDAYYGLSDQTTARLEIEALGLEIAPPGTHHDPLIQAFHQQEIAWSDVLTVPFAEYQTHLQSLRWANVVLAKSLQVEQTVQALEGFSMPNIPDRALTTQSKVRLRNWLQNVFEPDWVAIADLIKTQILHVGFLSSSPLAAGGIRTPSDDADDTETETEIRELICQLGTESTNVQRRRAAKQLGAIAQGNLEAIQALIQLLRSTDDDETLWAAVESLWQIDPGNPAAGVRRVRLLDLGLQVGGQTVALAVAVIQKSNQQMGIMLRVYPTGDEPYLPENLKLILLDDSGKTYEVSARRNDLYIQLKFSGTDGESFSVQVALETASITEDFTI